MLNIESIRDELTPVFKKYDVNSAILFGSYAKNNPRDNSDVDILVDSGLKGLAFFGLLEDIVTTLDKSVDLIDITQVAPDSRVMDEINRTGVKIYRREIKFWQD